MTREELKVHCEKQIEMCEFWAIGKGEKPSGKIYEEHKLILELLEQEPVIDKIKSDIVKFADTIPFVSGDIKAKYTNIGQHDGLEQALEIIEGNLKGDFDIDEWMAESE